MAGSIVFGAALMEDVMRRTLMGLGTVLLAGCASAPLTPPGSDMARSLTDTHWTISSINGTTPAAARKTEINFTADRISGNAGCNSFGGGYRLADNVLTAAQLISTKMACLGPGMEQESAVFKILASPVTIAWQEDGSLTLTDDAGTMTLAPVKPN